MDLIEITLHEYGKIKDIFSFQFFNSEFLDRLANLTGYKYVFNHKPGYQTGYLTRNKYEDNGKNHILIDDDIIPKKYHELISVCKEIKRINARYKIESLKILQYHRTEILKLTGISQYS
jgi:hypothetical protein